MPHGLSIGLFVAIVAPLVLIVWWEIKRGRRSSHSVSRASKYLEAQTDVRHTRSPAQETKRGFDAWD
jgi:hypothetical protein